MVEPPDSSSSQAPPPSSRSDEAWNEILNGDPSGSGPLLAPPPTSSSADLVVPTIPSTPSFGAGISAPKLPTFELPGAPKASPVSDETDSEPAAEAEAEAEPQPEAEAEPERETAPESEAERPSGPRAAAVVDASEISNVQLMPAVAKAKPAAADSSPKPVSSVPKVSPFGVVPRASASASMSGAAWGGPSPFGPGSSGFMPRPAASEPPQSAPPEADGEEASIPEGVIEAFPAASLPKLDDDASDADEHVEPASAPLPEEDSSVAAIAAVPAGVAFDDHEDFPVSRSGSALPWIVAGVIGLGLIGYFAMPSDATPEAPVAAQVEASMQAGEGTAATGGAVEDEDALDDAQPKSTAEPDDDAEPDPDTVVPDPEPEAPTNSKKKAKAKKKAKGKSKSKPAATGGGAAAADAGPGAEELLSEARKASLGGKMSEAYRLAKASYAKEKSSGAAQVMAISACKMGDARKAKSAYKKLPAAKKASVEKVCDQRGVSLD